MKLPLYWCFVVLATCLSCSNTKEELDAFNRKKTQREEIVDLESYISQGGVTKARLRSPLMIRTTEDSTYVEFPKTLHAEFFQPLPPGKIPDSLTVESHIYAKYGKYVETTNKMFIRDSVVCFNSLKKDTLWCDSLWWNQNEQIIYTWGKFRFKTHDGNDMRGDGNATGFRAKQDLSEYTLYKSRGVLKATDGVGIE